MIDVNNDPNRSALVKTVRTIELHNGSREERLPDFAPDFPYIASCCELSRSARPFVSWHWHPAAELFYIRDGSLEYHTPGGNMRFPEGSGGLVNCNVLHMTLLSDQAQRCVQYLHIFAPSFLAGEHDSRIARRYIMPLTASGTEIIPFFPDVEAHRELLHILQKPSQLSESAYGYELRLRAALSEIWLRLPEAAACLAVPSGRHSVNAKTDGRIKQMLAYIHEHYTEKLSASEIAASAYCSDRECFRLFQKQLHTTPSEYITDLRLQKACRMLTEGRESITQIGQSCGLGSGSYFGKVFRQRMGQTPAEYRREWQDTAISWQK